MKFAHYCYVTCIASTVGLVLTALYSIWIDSDGEANGKLLGTLLTLAFGSGFLFALIRARHGHDK